MKKIIEKVIPVEAEDIKSVKIIIAQNDNGELKIGNEEDFNRKSMRAIALDGWNAIGLDFLHAREKEDGLYFNIGAHLPEGNQLFPYKMLELEELKMITALAK